MFKRYFYTEGLTNLLGSDGKYLININGQVKNSLGNDVETKYDSEGHHIVTVQGYKGMHEYRVIDLIALQFKNLHPKAIRQAAFSRGNKLYHGHRFRLGVSSDPWPTTNIKVS